MIRRQLINHIFFYFLQAGKLDEDDPVDLEDLLEKLLRQQKEKSKKTQLKEHEEYIRFREGLQEQINNGR